MGPVVAIITLDFAERLGKAFVGFWIGFLTTIALAVASYSLMFDLVFTDGGSYPFPPTLGLALSVAAIIVGRYVSVAFEKFDLMTLLQWTGADVAPRQESLLRGASRAASNTIPPALNKPVH